MTAKLRLVWALALVAGLFVVVQSLAVRPAHADSQTACEARGGTWTTETGPSGTIEFVCKGGTSGPGEPPTEPPPKEGDTRDDQEMWEKCTVNNPDPSVENPGCGGEVTCTPPDEPHNQYLRNEIYHNGRWQWDGSGPGNESGDGWSAGPEGTQCKPPTVSAEQVWQALTRKGFPGAETEIEPVNGRTLVKLRTNFYTEAEGEDIQLPVGPVSVHVIATPAEYRWNFGDGHKQTSTNPGAKYPDLKVTHRYEKPGKVQPSVRVMYRVQWEFNGGGLQTFDELLPATGAPGTNLEVVESQARLRN